MPLAPAVLAGVHIRLEPLEHRHAEGLATAASIDRSLYRWSLVPKGRAEFERYIDSALSMHAAGKVLAFATVRIADDAVLGSTRFLDVESLPWPAGHPRHSIPTPDACEVGGTWLSAPAIRTSVNTEAKLLMLTHAFETWKVLRVCLHTDVRNDRSAAAIERIGARFEGVLRAHRMASDFIPRDSKRFSILAAEWPQVKHRLHRLLSHHAPAISEPAN